MKNIASYTRDGRVHSLYHTEAGYIDTLLCEDGKVDAAMRMVGSRPSDIPEDAALLSFFSNACQSIVGVEVKKSPEAEGATDAP